MRWVRMLTVVLEVEDIMMVLLVMSAARRVCAGFVGALERLYGICVKLR